MELRVDAAQRFEPGIVRLAEVAALALGVPYAAVTCFAGDRATVVAGVGFDPLRTLGAADLPYDARVVSDGLDVVVKDTGADGRRGSGRRPGAFADARSYAGTALVDAQGRRFGTLSVRDRVPRDFTNENVAVLREFATLVVEQLDVRRRFAEADTIRRQLSTLVDASPIAIATLDLGGRVLTWSPATERLFGFATRDAVGAISPDFPGGRNNRDLRDLLAAMRRGASFFMQRSRRVCADGKYVDVRFSAAPLFAPDGSVSGFVSMAESVEERERAEHRIRLLESVVVSSNDAVMIATAEPRDNPTIVYVNEAFTHIYGYEAEEVVGRSTRVLHATDADPTADERIAKARRMRIPFTVELLHCRAAGTSFWCEASYAPVFDVNGTCDNWVVVSRDVTERRRTEQMQEVRSDLLELVATDAPLSEIFDALVRSAEDVRPGASAAITLVEGDHTTLAVRGRAFGQTFRGDAAYAAAIAGTHDPTARALASGRQIAFVNLEPTLHTGAASSDRGAACWATPIRGGADAIFGAFTMFVCDAVTPTLFDLRLGTEFAQLASIAIDRQRDREQLVFLAHHDALTELPNRVLFEQRARAAIAQARTDAGCVAIGIVDLDRFKVVNDSFGHETGDRLLSEVADRLERYRRDGDTVARLGGDEFVVLFADIDDRADAEERARRLLLGLGPTFNCAGQEVFVRASMGVSLFPDDATELETLLGLCDGAMYEAKAQARDLAFHERRDARDAMSRIRLETSLAHALERGEFSLVYQPQVDLDERALRGVEALLRWNHHQLGEVLPEAFVRAAEDTGLIVPLGAWVLEEACRFARRWQDSGVDRFVSVNVSARQFDRRDFVDVITRTLVRTGLDPARLHLELTESLIMRSPETVASTLAQLKDLGVKIVIDDFGTGYSSFNYLKRFPLDALKIDRLFVRDIGVGKHAPNDEAIVRAIVGVARALELKIIAEGVENEDQAAFLRAIGVPLAQGFLFAPGLSAAEAMRWPLRSAAP